MKRNQSIILYIATSLDGYIAREDGSIDWLYEVEGEGDNGYQAFYETIDTVIMGNKTYEQTKTLADEFPYKGKRCYVFSKTDNVPDENVQYVNESIIDFLHKLEKERNIHNIWIVGGAELLDGFLKEKVVDEFIVSIIPTILGKGIPLFKDNNSEIQLELRQIKQFGQIAQLYYKKLGPDYRLK